MPIAALITAMCAMLASGAAQSQNYPSKPIRFIVPFPPGGGNDIVGRIVAQKLAEGFGLSVVVDNRGGAGGTVGTEMAAKAPADGHTMLVNNISLAVNATLFPKLPYDTLKDLAPVTLVGRQPNIVVVNPSVPARSVRELLALAQAKPGQINYGSGGVGTASHLATELLKLMAKVDMVHVPYKGLGPALTDLMGGQIQLIISTLASALPQVRAGKLRALAVTTAKRSAFFPEIPSMDEAGVRGYEFSTWYGLLVPARTPRSIVDRLNQEMARVLGSGAVNDQFASQGLEAAHTSPQEFGVYLKSEVEKWAKVVKASGAKPE
ncbi:MAG TPA: tripartite tricarboxylate transporter substrate binding protein [Burkholderiales bacterium]|jgi:tripartite-type tricarboxylate transporter receptor subunit TctC|nr:tripartite tricarboxylate transporter substrate binding protein [Burkholderiales bacterium]